MLVVEVGCFVILDRCHHVSNIAEDQQDDQNYDEAELFTPAATIQGSYVG